MKNHPTRLVLMPLAFFTLLAGCQAPTDNPVLRPARSWDVALIEAGSGTAPESTLVGTVVSGQRVEVAARLMGSILKMNVQEGDVVRRGQLLVQLDAAEVEGGVRQSRAVVASAQVSLANAQTDRERFQPLFERGSVSEREWRAVQLRFESARESLNQSQAGLDTARAQFSHTSIHSPIDAVVVARSKRRGELATPGQPLLTLESSRDLVFETFVPQSQRAAFVPGKTLDVHIDGLPQPLAGVVSRIAPSSDPVTHRQLVKITLPAAEDLRPGMFGRIQLAQPVLGGSPSPSVPMAALVERGGLRGVFVVDADSRARFRWLRIGREWPDRVEVTAGLLPGEQLLATVDAALRDGDHVNALKAKP